MILDNYFHSGICFQKLNSTILSATQVSKAAGIDNLSECFLKDVAKSLSKPISDLGNLSITSEKFADSC